MRSKLLIVFLVISLGLSAQTDKEYNYEYALIEANRQKAIGNLNEALNLYSRCLIVKPESGVAAYELGNIFIAMNDPDKAYEYFERAYNSDPGNYWYMIAYIEILNFKAEYSEAEKVILIYLKKKDDPKLRYSLAGIYENQREFKKARKQLEIIELNYGISETILLKKAEIYKKENKITKGEKELLKLKEYLPDSPDYYILLAEYLNDAGIKERAAGFFMDAYLLDSTNLYAITNLADYYIQNNDISKGFQFLEKAFSDSVINLENKLKTFVLYLENVEFIKRYTIETEQLVKSLLNLYEEENIVHRVAYDFYFKIEDYQNAFTQIKILLELESDNYSLWQQAIYNASVLNLSDEMISIGKRAIEIFPNKSDLYLFVGIGYYQKNDFQKAYDILKDNYIIGLETNTQMQFLTFLGESAYKIRLFDEAFSYFEELILLDPNNLLVLNNYSYYLSLEDINLERAERLSYKTIIAEPENPVYLDTYGWVLFKLNRMEESLNYLNKASKLSNDPDVLFHYAEVLYITGNKKQACEYYSKAKDAGFDPDSIKIKLEICF
ncbi:MAG: hypothetical protein K9H49_09950 [Bacteroidales bacterium]|nr:hypothetical protein [Bacteroidales bacterium]MCF8389674.1 hypothetical protein [Bacteroidales bacterium]